MITWPDGLARVFLVIVLVAGAATAVTGGGWRSVMATGCAVLTLLAADGSLLVTGTALAMAAAGRPAGLVVLCAVALTIATALTGQGEPANLAPGLAPGLVPALVGAAGLAGLFPFHAWLPRRGAAAAITTPLGFYVLLRLLVPGGPAQPAWLAIVLLGLGVATVVLAGARALVADTLAPAVGSAVSAQAGIAAVGIGLALLERASDLSAAAALTLGGVLAQLAAVALAAPLLTLAVCNTARGAGTLRLDRLGGLATRMPVTSGALLISALWAATLPGGPGFVGPWIDIQAAIIAARAGGPLLGGVIGAAVLGLACGIGLLAAAMLRLVGVVCLGRPRTPRASAAEEVAPVRVTVALGAATLALGFLPAPLLRAVGPALEVMAGTGGGAGLLSVNVPSDMPGYAALPLAGLLVMAFALVRLLMRLAGPAPQRHVVSAWRDGSEPWPRWLPFGDPLAQAGPAGLVPAPLRSLLRGRAARWRDPAEAVLAAARRRGRRFGLRDRPASGPAGVALLAALTLGLAIAAGGR